MKNWIVELILNEITEYKSVADIMSNDRKLFKEIKKFNLTDNVCSHMVSQQKGIGYWNDFNRCKEESLKY